MAKRKNRIIIISGILIIFLGISFFIYENHKKGNIEKANDEMIDIFFNEEVDQVVESEEVVKEIKTANYNYMAVLEIPSINLKRGLVEIDSYYNNVSYNLEILKGSSMPNILNSNLIIAGHNGNSYVSFFKSLDKLHKGDVIVLYYQNKKYEYSLDYIYEINKNGSVEIIRDTTKTTITLITCKKNSKDKQVVYIGYLARSNQY